ncbi:MAG TPA: hypothetical protein VF787_26365 [Thermoanaerobaculia bacterium]
MHQERPDSRPSTRRRAAAIAIAAIWLIIAGAGAIALLARESRAADRGSTPSTWPASTKLEHATDKPTLLMFMHPNCPCTRASVTQLTRILAAAPRGLQPKVIFVARPAAEHDWRVDWLTSMTRDVPGSTYVLDAKSAEANRFGATTSGHVLLYSADGTLHFDGGVTLGRGHQGDNDAAESLSRALALPENEPVETAVFGCAIEPRTHRSGP